MTISSEDILQVLSFYMLILLTAGKHQLVYKEKYKNAKCNIIYKGKLGYSTYI